MDVTLLMGLSAQPDPAAQQKAMMYFEQLKASEDGWKVCATQLTSGEARDEYVKFFCFQVIEHYLNTRYCSASVEEQQNVKNLLVSWLQQQGSCSTPDKSYLRNKAAQIFSLALVADFPTRWPSFFSDLLGTLALGKTAVDMYLRILLAIDSEVVDRDISHTQTEADRNTNLKDAMRIHCVEQLVDSWYQIIKTYEESDPEITCRCLDVIGAYIAWIDIGLIANERFVALLMRFMSRLLLRESTVDCIVEIVSKGMEPLAKTELIESFMSVLNNAAVFNIKEDDDSDYLAKLSKLVNAIGTQLILCWQRLAKSGDFEKSKMILNAQETKVSLLFTFLAHEDDDVSGAVAKFAHDYVTVLKQITPLRPAQAAHVKTLLEITMDKMKYDEYYNFQTEGEEEAMFQEYRKDLRVIFNNLGALDANLVLSTVHAHFTKTTQAWQTLSARDVELAITMLYGLAEAIPSLSVDAAKTNILNQMMRLLVTSRVSCYQHTAVSLQFFETVVRYDKFFSQEPSMLADVLMAFLDERGLRSRSPQVCSRSAYLFSRFIKNINKVHLQEYLDDLLKRIQDLLVLQTPGQTLTHGLSTNDQLFVYEITGILIVQSSFPPEKKQACMKDLLAPIVSKFDALLQSMVSASEEQQQQAYAECLSQAMAFASRTSKGFSPSVTMQACGCVDVFTHTLGVFLSALGTPVHRPLIHAGVRQFLHRMVVCMGAEVLPFIPAAMEHLLKTADARELHDFIPLINQVVCKYKREIVPFLQEVFMPIVSAIFAVLLAPSDSSDQVAANEKKMLRRGYFGFISGLVNNNVTEVLSNQELSNLEQVLMTVIQGAVEIPDPTGQKSCFNILKRLLEIWVGKDGLSGFEDFLYKNIIPACFMAPLKPTFDLGDAQTVLCLNECAACLKVAYERKGDEMLHFLHGTYLPSLNIAQNLVDEFCHALKSDHKIFRNYFKSFFLRAKS